MSYNREEFYKERISNIKNFVNSYNTHYGHLQFIETKTCFIVETENGGWSDNEELESQLVSIFPPILRNHPTTIWTLNKHMVSDEGFIEWFRNQTYYFKNDKYKVVFTIE